MSAATTSAGNAALKRARRSTITLCPHTVTLGGNSTVALAARNRRIECFAWVAAVMSGVLASDVIMALLVVKLLGCEHQQIALG